MAVIRCRAPNQSFVSRRASMPSTLRSTARGPAQLRRPTCGARQRRKASRRIMPGVTPAPWRAAVHRGKRPSAIRRAGEGLVNEEFDRPAATRGSAPPDWPRPAGRDWPTSGAELPAASKVPKTGMPRTRRPTKGRAGPARPRLRARHGNFPPHRRDRRRSDGRRPPGRSSGRDRTACYGRGTAPLSWWLKNRPPAATHESAGFAFFRTSDCVAIAQAKRNQPVL